MEADDIKWRVQLRAGQEIDVLKYDSACKASMWSVGRIEDVCTTDLDETHPVVNLVREVNGCATVPQILMVKFKFDASVPEINLSSDSPDICPLGTKSCEEEWRLSLK
jgi:hypothetical protein